MKKITARECPTVNVHITPTAKASWETKVEAFASEWKVPRFIVLSSMLDAFDPNNPKFLKAVRQYGYGSLDESLNSIVKNIEGLTDEEIEKLTLAITARKEN